MGGGAVTRGADAFALVTDVLDPVLAAYGFAAGQGSCSDPVPGEEPTPVDGMVIFCRALADGSPGCEDVVVHLRALPTWNVLAVTVDDPRGYWSLDYDGDAPLPDRLAEIATELRARLAAPGPETSVVTS